MSPHEARAKDTREWMAKAVEDLACAIVLSGAGHEGSALFHCQQCAEKSLKAFLTWHGRPFRKTHDLKEVGPIPGSLREANASRSSTRSWPRGAVRTLELHTNRPAAAQLSPGTPKAQSESQ